MCFNFHSLYSNSFEASYRIYEYLIKKKNNILFDDGNLAANHINSIWDNPLDWWNSDKLLNVRKKFMNQFAMTSSKPINKWEKKLEKIYIKF
jgi:putative transferase (TIGR04331 family)